MVIFEDVWEYRYDLERNREYLESILPPEVGDIFPSLTLTNQNEDLKDVFQGENVVTCAPQIYTPSSSVTQIERLTKAVGSPSGLTPPSAQIGEEPLSHGDLLNEDDSCLSFSDLPSLTPVELSNLETIPGMETAYWATIWNDQKTAVFPGDWICYECLKVKEDPILTVPNAINPAWTPICLGCYQSSQHRNRVNNFSKFGMLDSCLQVCGFGVPENSDGPHRWTCHWCIQTNSCRSAIPGACYSERYRRCRRYLSGIRHKKHSIRVSGRMKRY